MEGQGGRCVEGKAERNGRERETTPTSPAVSESWNYNPQPNQIQ